MLQESHAHLAKLEELSVAIQAEIVKVKSNIQEAAERAGSIESQNMGCRNKGTYNTGHDNKGNYNTGNENRGNYNTGNGNSGNYNTGDQNKGHKNSGSYNKGDTNTGYYNTGDYNSGMYNDGSSNNGDCNIGYTNKGSGNIGCGNIGDHNWGYRNVGSGNKGTYNTGDGNKGDSNTGDWNKGSYNSGCFNTEEPKLMFFDRPTNMTLKDWRESDAYRLLKRVEFSRTKWVSSEDMTKEEKLANRGHRITGGYLKAFDDKDCYIEWWSKLTGSDRDIIRSIPNFNRTKFYTITGIWV